MVTGLNHCSEQYLAYSDMIRIPHSAGAGGPVLCSAHVDGKVLAAGPAICQWFIPSTIDVYLVPTNTLALERELSHRRIIYGIGENPGFIWC